MPSGVCPAFLEISTIKQSENPTFGFTLAGEPGGELRVEAVDNRDRRFEGRWTLGAAG